MTIFIDPPMWPAHGTEFSHLISNESLEELHTLAMEASISERAFDLDHYDVPAFRYQQLLTLGAVPVSCSELVRILIRSGLRITARERRQQAPVLTARIR